MEYNIKAHETIYKNVIFRSRLEARWAAFFDLIGWKWEYEPIELQGWLPDFRLIFPCPHSECGGEHVVLVEIKPYFSLSEFRGHQCTKYPYGFNEDTGQAIPADASGGFGANPNITAWTMAHGSGGGGFSLRDWLGNDDDIDIAWVKAGNIVRFIYP